MNVGMLARVSCLLLIVQTACLAADTNLMPWLIISSNRADCIRQDFYALQRPVLDRWDTETRRGPALFFGFSADMTGPKMILTSNAQAFIANNVALTSNKCFACEEIGAAMWPVLLDTNYSGDATAILVGLLDSAFTMAGPKFQATGYISPSNRGTWDASGAEVRTWLRWELCREWWLDNHGIPVAVPGGRLPPGSQHGCVLSNCTDEAASR